MNNTDMNWTAHEGYFHTYLYPVCTRFNYRKVSNIGRTNSQNLNASRLIV